MKDLKNKLRKRFTDIICKAYKKISKNENDINADMYLDKNEKFEPFVMTLTNHNDLRKLRAFENKHIKKCGGHDVIGAWFTYEIMPTGLGDIWTVTCPCGAHIDLTEDFG